MTFLNIARLQQRVNVEIEKLIFKKMCFILKLNLHVYLCVGIWRSCLPRPEEGAGVTECRESLDERAGN